MKIVEKIDSFKSKSQLAAEERVQIGLQGSGLEDMDEKMKRFSARLPCDCLTVRSVIVRAIDEESGPSSNIKWWPMWGKFDPIPCVGGEFGVKIGPSSSIKERHLYCVQGSVHLLILVLYYIPMETQKVNCIIRPVECI